MTAQRVETWQDDFMAIAWRDFVLWTSDQPEMRAAFTKAMGIPYLAPARNPIDAAIDKATGARAHVAEAFTKWVTETHWGIDDAPLAYREALRLEQPSPSHPHGVNKARHSDDLAGEVVSK